MIRNYNGSVNRTVLRTLKALCDKNAKNKDRLLEILYQKGEVSVYENLDPFTGCPDEMSTVVTMKNEAEVEKYLKKDFLRRVNNYLHYHATTKDYLQSAVIRFVKKYGIYPDKCTMKQLEKEAEAKRVAASPSKADVAPKKITEQEIAKEILELAEETMEARRERKPEDIFVHVEPYDDELSLLTDEMDLTIRWDRYEGIGDCTDYRCVATIKKNGIRKIFFQYLCDGAASFRTDFSHFQEQDELMQTLFSVHKFIAEMAEKEGVEFTSEIVYPTEFIKNASA